MKAEFLYRDGANYKDYVEIESDLIPNDLTEGDDIEMETIGTSFEKLFDRSYDELYDHNILEFIRYIDEPEQENKQETKQLPSVWEFVEKYYPNYHSCDEIAHADDLSKIINNECQDGDDSYELWQEILTQFNGNEEEAMKDAKYRYNEHHIRIYNEAIEGLGVKSHEIYEWVTGLIGDNNDKVVRYTDLVYRDIAGGNLTHDEQDEMMQLGLEVREEAINEYIKQKGGL